MTKAQFKRKAVAMFTRANPTATVGAWEFGPNPVKWANGKTGMAGGFYATAPGYRPRVVIASMTPDGFGVR
jgi:hypothetical protein